MDVLHEGLLQKWVLGSAGIEFSRVSWLKLYQQEVLSCRARTEKPRSLFETSQSKYRQAF